MNVAFSTIGRLLIALYFIISAMRGFTDIQGFAQMPASKGLPYPLVLAYIALFTKLIGGILVATAPSPGLLGLGVLALVIFMLIITPIFYPVWEDMSHMMDFLGHSAIVGGLLNL